MIKFILTFIFGFWTFSLLGQNNFIPASIYQNPFFINSAVSGSIPHTRTDFLWRQNSTETTGIFTLQIPRIGRKDSTQLKEYANGLGTNFTAFGNSERKGFRIGLTKSFYRVAILEDSKEVIFTPSPWTIGFEVGADQQNNDILADFSASILFRHEGFLVGASTRKFWIENPQTEVPNENFTNRFLRHSTFFASKYMIVGLLKRMAIEPKITYFQEFGKNTNWQFDITADFWRDWEHGTPILQTYAGYRLNTGFLGGISYRITPRLALNYTREFWTTQTEIFPQNSSNEVSISYDFGYKKRTSPPIFTSEVCGGDLPHKPTECGYPIDTIYLGKKYEVGDLINDYVGKIGFEEGTAELLDESYEALDKLARMMIVNPAVRVEVGCHVDTLSNQYALELTQKRADAIKTYVQDVKGVQLGRVVAIGFGRTRQEEGKKPDRVEIKLIAVHDEDE